MSENEQFAEGVRHALEYLGDLFEGVEDTDIYKEYMQDEIENQRLEKVSQQNKDEDYSLNDVALRGWVTTIATQKELPNGDLISQFRIAITRPEGGVDTIDIEAWSPETQRVALKLQDGDWIEINGSIRRRFWKASSGLASRWQVVTSRIDWI